MADLDLSTAQQVEHQVTLVRALVVRHASAAQCLLDVAEKETVDLILLSAHGSACDAG